MTAKAPEITMGHAIEFGRGETAPPPVNPDALAAHQLSTELSKLQAQQSGEAAIKGQAERRREARFGEKEADSLRQQFGNGEVKRDRTGKLIGGTSEMKSNYEEADKRITTAHNYLTYTEVLLESQRTGKSIDDTITRLRTEGKLSATYNRAEYDRMRSVGLKALLEIDELRNYAGLSGLTEAQQLDYLEEAFGTDPAMREKIAAKLRQVASQTESLPTTKDPKQQEIENEITTKSQLITDELKQLKTRFDLKADAVDSLKKELEFGNDAQTIQAKVLEFVAAKAGIPHPEHIGEYFDLQDAYNARAARIAELDAKIAAGPRGASAAERGERASLAAMQSNAATELTGLRTTMGGLSDTDLATHRNPYMNLKRQVMGTKAADGTVTGGISKNAQELVNNQTAVKNKNAELATLKAAGGPGNETQRMLQESNLITDLDTIFLDAVAETIKERQQALTGLQNKQLEAQAEQADQSGDHSKAQAIRAIQKRINENWIHYDPTTRSRDVNRDQIGEDIRTLAYYEGQDGVKRLIARDLVREGFFGNLTIDERVQRDGITAALTTVPTTDTEKIAELTTRKQYLEDKHARFSSAGGEPLTADEKVQLFGITTALTSIPPSEGDTITRLQERKRYLTDKVGALRNGAFDQLSKEELALFTSIVEGQGEAYKNRLFADYVTARGPRAGFKGDALNLRNHEILHIDQNYGGSFASALEKSADGKKALESLKKKGIRPSVSMLVAIFLLLGAGGAKLFEKLGGGTTTP